MSYRYLTSEDQVRIVAEVKASIPTVESVEWEREAAHFRSVVEAKLGLHDAPDDLVPAPDAARREQDHAVLDAEAAKLEAAVAVVEVKR